MARSQADVSTKGLSTQDYDSKVLFALILWEKENQHHSSNDDTGTMS